MKFDPYDPIQVIAVNGMTETFEKGVMIFFALIIALHIVSRIHSWMAHRK